ncbi:MAG: EamA family transporter [Gammaproteobacteria bacterium]
MWRFYFVGFLSLLAFDTAAQVCFKFAALAAAPFSPDVAWLLRVAGTPWVYGSIGGYVGAFLTWMMLLERAPLGPAFAASHLEVISVLFLSAVLFDEPLGSATFIGCAAIVLGIVCLAASPTESLAAQR